LLGKHKAKPINNNAAKHKAEYNNDVGKHKIIITGDVGKHKIIIRDEVGKHKVIIIMGDGETQGVYVHDRICHGFDTGRQGS
jgi:hypothetical protein